MMMASEHRSTIFALARLGTVGSAVLIGAAMFFYPGGAALVLIGAYQMSRPDKCRWLF